MNDEEAPVIQFSGRCLGCGAPTVRKYCRCCVGFRAYVVEWGELQLTLASSHWAKVNQEERLEEYLRYRLWQAIRRLPHDCDLLAEVLEEIAELAEDSGDFK